MYLKILHKYSEIFFARFVSLFLMHQFFQIDLKMTTNKINESFDLVKIMKKISLSEYFFLIPQVSSK